MTNKLINFIKRKRYKFQSTVNDFWLISYPRSGNTWIRLILANYIWHCPRVANLGELQVYIPDIHYKRSEINPKRFSGVHRIIKSHEQFRKDYSQVIYVYRNPFDCAWSYFRFIKDLKGSYSGFDEFVTDFLGGKLSFGSWADHLTQWYRLHNGKHVFLCYEDIVQNPKLYLCQMVSFLGLDFSEERAEKALSNASAEIVSQITNDRVFYGKEFTTFVTSPLGMDKQTKEYLRSEYTERFREWNLLYEEFRSNKKI